MCKKVLRFYTCMMTSLEKARRGSFSLQLLMFAFVVFTLCISLASACNSGTFTARLSWLDLTFFLVKTHAEVAVHMAKMFDFTGKLNAFPHYPFMQRVLKGRPYVKCFEDGDNITRCKANIKMVRYNHLKYVRFHPSSNPITE